jgi:hypothetical protein
VCYIYSRVVGKFQFQGKKLSDLAEKNGEKKLPRSIIIKILIFLGLVALSVVAMRPIQIALHEGINNIRINFIGRIEAATGMEIRYSSIRPTFLGSFDIRNLRLIKNENTILSVSRARIFYSLPDLLRRKKTALRGIQIDRPVIRLDLERDRDLFSMFNGKGGENNFSQILADFFPDQPDFKIRNGSFTLTGNKVVYLLQDMDVNVKGKDSVLFVDSKLDGELRYSSSFIGNFTVKTRAGINGAWNMDLRQGSAEIFFSSITGSGQGGIERNGSFFMLPANDGGGTRTLFEVRPLFFALVFSDGILGISSTGEASFNGSFDYNTQTGGIRAGIGCNNFPITDLVKFSDVRKDINHLLSMAVTGSASFETESGGVMRYEAAFLSAAFQSERGTGDSFVLRANGSEESVVVDEFRFSAGTKTAEAGFFYGNIGFSGRTGFSPFTPEGTISIGQFSLSGEGGINASFTVSTAGREIQVSGENIEIGQCTLNSADIFLLPSDRGLSVLAYSICGDEGAVNMEAIFDYEPRQLEVSFSLDSFSVLYIPQIIRPFRGNIGFSDPVQMLLKNPAVDAEVFITTDFKNIVYNVPSIYIRTDDITASLSFSGSDRQFTLSEGVFTRNEKDFLVSAQVNFSNPMDLVFFVNANYLDISWQFEGQVLDRSTLIIRDPSGLHAYGSTSTSGGISGYLEGMNFPIPVNGQPAYLDFYITLRYLSRDFWYLDIAHFEARSVNSPNRIGLRISGIADQDGASFRNLLYRDSAGELSGNMDFAWNSNFSNLQFLVNITDGHENGEKYHIEGGLKNSHFDVFASVSDMHVDRFLRGRTPLTINAETSLSWDSINSFNARLDLKSLNVRLQNNDIKASAEVVFTNDELAVHALRLGFAKLEAYIPVLQMSRVDGFASASADIQGQILRRAFTSKLELDAKFNSIDSWIDIKHALDSMAGSLKAENLRYGEIQGEPSVFAFTRENGELSVSGGPRNMLRLEIDSDGDFFASLSSPSPIRSTAAGTYKNGYLDAHFADFFLDLPALWKFLPPMPNFYFNGGYLTAKIDARGPITNPEFFGSGRGSSLRMQVPNYVNQDIRPVPFDFVIEGNELVFNRVALVSGNGRGTVDGWLRFENWIPRDLGLEIAVPRESPVPCHFNVTNFMANGDASGRMSIILENMALEITGDLYANNTTMGLGNDESRVRADSDSTGTRITAAVNLTVTTGPVVEFVWPNVNMPMLRATPVMGTVLAVSVDTESGQYSLVSDIMIRSGELYYFDRNFYIRQGNLVLRESEQQFNPRLSARAEIRDRTDSGPVTISMIIENEPLLRFVPRFESTPVLTQLELYSLLGQNLYGVAGAENMDTAQRFIVSSTTDLVAQFVANSEFFAQFDAVRRFERSIRNLLRLDMFSVRTRFLQNAFSNAAMPALSPVDRNYRVGNYFDNTTVFIGKYVGQDMFIQGMLSMRYDENNPDYGGLRFEPDIGIELQSPLFNIRWGFFPYHPENWWVNDNSITITVRRTF